MLVIAACGVIFLACLVAVALWGGAAVRVPDRQGATGRMPSGEVARRYLWWLTVAAVAGLGAAVFAGVGGRLVMRLLAATSPDAQGRITEAAEVVGVISVEGTVALFIFGGLPAGVLSVILYLVVQRWLPAGRLGGFSFGVLLLLLASTRLEPLRPDNFDFSIVGPGWLALSTFGLLVVAHGMLVAALFGRFSQSLPMLKAPLRTNDRRTIVRYWPLVPVVVLFPLALLALAVGLAVVTGSRLVPSTRLWRSSRLVTAGRVLLVAGAVASLPSFVSAASIILALS